MNYVYVWFKILYFIYIYVCYVKTFNCCMFKDIINATLSIINLFNVFHVFILYIFPHHISLVTISVSVYMLFLFLPVHTSFLNFCKFLLVNKLKLN